MIEREVEHSSSTTVTIPEISDRKRHATLLRGVTIAAAVVDAPLIALYVLLYLRTGAWQMLGVAGLAVLALACTALAGWLIRLEKFNAAGYVLLFAVTASYGGGELVMAGLTVSLLVGGIMLIFLVGNAVLPRRWRTWLMTAGLFGVFIWLANQFEPLPRYDTAQLPLINFLTLSTTILVALMIAWQIGRAFRVGTIRTRLLIAFVGIVLLPAVITGTTAGIVGVQSVQRRLFDQVETVASFKETAINTWVSDLHSNLDDVLDVSTTLFSRTVLQADDITLYQEMRDDLRRRFQTHIDRSGLFEELLLLDLQGEALVSTVETHEGTIHSSQPYFREGLKGAYVQPPFYSSPGQVSFYSLSPGQMVMVVARPIADQRGQAVGVLVGRVDTARLNEIMTEQTGLSKTSKTYLVDLNHILLTQPRFGDVGTYAYTYATDTAIEKHASGTGVYDDYRGERVVGAYHWLPELQVVLLAEQDRAEVLGEMYAMVGIIGGVTVAAVLTAVAVSLFIARSIADPLTKLAETATHIAAGDLERTAEVEREDEIGTLAQAFNQMTIQLRDLIGGLEQRVADRTRGLQAAAEVARATTSMLDPDLLLWQVVDLVRERFDLYYVGLFLLDEERRFAVLRAGTGEAGQQMMAQGHKLEVGGGSMIGRCVARGEARIALDVGAEAVRFDNPLLPETRSEMALPMRSRGRVIGAMTVQSTEEAAFDETDIAVMQTMADQVAVALDNARLFAESQAALEAMRRAYGELTGKAWAELLRARPDLAYRSDERGVISAEDVWRPEMEQALQRGEIVRSDGADSDGKLSLAVPIEVRGNVIAVLDTYKPAEAGEWTPEEVSTLEALADQLGQALESARLYEDAQRRAAYEQLTGEITARMRSSLDVDTVLQTAVREMRRVLGLAEAEVWMGVDLATDEAG